MSIEGCTGPGGQERNARVSLHRDDDVTLNEPFGFGPDMSAAEARERIEYSADTVETAPNMITTLPDTTER